MCCVVSIVSHMRSRYNIAPVINRVVDCESVRIKPGNVETRLDSGGSSSRDA